MRLAQEDTKEKRLQGVSSYFPELFYFIIFQIIALETGALLLNFRRLSPLISFLSKWK